MKKIIAIIVILISSKGFSQTVDSIALYQKKNLNEAIQYLKEGDIVRATMASYSANQWNPKSEVGLKSLKMADSLLPLAQDQIKSRIIGQWVLVKSGSNWGYANADRTSVEKILVISKTHFEFYDHDVKTNKQKLTKKEKIRFTKFPGMLNVKFDFVFSDQTLWSFYLNEDHSLRQTNTSAEAEKDRTEILCGNPEYHYVKRN